MSRLLSFGFVLFSFLFVFGPLSYAQELNPNQTNITQPISNTNSYNSFQPKLAPDVAPNLGVLTQGVILEVLAGFSCQLSGYDPLSADGKCIVVDPKTRQLTKAETTGGGAIAFVTRGIGNTFDIPVSSTQYIASLQDQFGITKPAYAQQLGTGYESLRPILEVWRTFRNLVFLFFVLIFSAVGIGIMFRFKMDARTVMTIQNQIPKLTIGLVLITFSYAIAGFLVDMMYVLIYLVLNIGTELYTKVGIYDVTPPNINQSTFGFVNHLYTPDVPVIGGSLGIASIAFKASVAIAQVITGLFSGIIDSVLGTFIKMLTGPWALIPGVCGLMDTFNLSNIPLIGGFFNLGGVGKFIPFVGGGGPACESDTIARGIVGAITGLIAFLVVLVAILFSLFRLWFQLIKSYLFLLLDIVFAPFWIAASLVPNGGLGFSAWVRDVIANLAVFPTVIGILYMGRIFIDAFGRKSGGFIPPLIGDAGDHNQIGALIGLGMILLTPQLTDTVKGVFKTKSPNFPAIAAGVGAGRAGEAALRGGLTKKFWHRNHTTGELEGPAGEWAQGRGNKALRFMLGVKGWNRPEEDRIIVARKKKEDQRAADEKEKREEAAKEAAKAGAGGSIANAIAHSEDIASAATGSSPDEDGSNDGTGSAPTSGGSGGPGGGSGGGAAPASTSGSGPSTAPGGGTPTPTSGTAPSRSFRGALTGLSRGDKIAGVAGGPAGVVAKRGISKGIGRIFGGKKTT